MSSFIQSAIDEYLFAKKGKITAKTYRWYKQKLIVFSAWCTEQSFTSLDQLRSSEIRKFLHSLTEQTPPLSGYTRKGYTQVIKQFIRWCAEEETFEHQITAKTANRVENPKIEKTVIEPFSTADVKALLDACEREDTRQLKERAKAIVFLLLDTGIRASELAYDGSRPEEETGLRIHNVFFDPGDSFIRVMGKGRKERDISIGQRTRTCLRRYIMRYRGKTDLPYVFLTRTGEPLTVRGLEEFINRLGDRAKVGHCFAHRFRHTFAHQFKLANKDIHELSKILGHTSVKVTENYLQKFSFRGHYSVGDNL